MSFGELIAQKIQNYCQQVVSKKLFCGSWLKVGAFEKLKSEIFVKKMMYRFELQKIQMDTVYTTNCTNYNYIQILIHA